MRLRALVASVIVALLVSCGAQPAKSPKVVTPAGNVDVLIFGDSVAAGTGDEQQLGIAGNLRRLLLPSRARVINAAVPGSRTGDVLRRLHEQRTELRRANVVILSIGGNDLYGSRPEQVVSRFLPRFAMWRVSTRVEAVVAAIHAVNPGAAILLIGLYNPYVETGLGPTLTAYVREWDGRLLLRFAGDPSVTVVPIADTLLSQGRLSTIDHFHPGSAGYSAIARRLVTSSIFAGTTAATN